MNGRIIFSQFPYRTAIEELTKEFKGITVAYFTNKDIGFSKMLLNAGFSVSVATKENFEIPDSTRLIVADCEGRLLSQAKSIKNGMPLYIITHSPDRECFSNRCVLDNQISICGMPNAVIIDESTADKASLISSLFTLLTDITDIIMSFNKCMPALETLKNEITDMLICPKDLHGMVGLLSMGEKTLASFELTGISDALKYVNRERCLGHNYAVVDFFSAYLVNIMLFKFTFLKNNVILISADRVRIRTLAKSPKKPLEKSTGPCFLRERQRAFALSKEELRAIAYNFRMALGDMQKTRPDTSEILNNILIGWEWFDWDGLTNALVGQGFIEELLKNGIDS